jgi:predicted DNA-binding transcriptional regulator AlpA
MSVSSTGLSDHEKQIAKPLGVSIEAACKLTGIGRTLMFELIKCGRVKTVKIGRRRVVIYASLETLCAYPEFLK